jgi:hypothetical protein
LKEKTETWHATSFSLTNKSFFRCLATKVGLENNQQ